ncbi:MULTISPECIES: YeeE/YedE family protein [unclassified Paracoccus (in: a-proteobacteria)]|uniref:YeeE/YedE family protein n=1 Tax=unclassified Paracoccus (in: a-proteobacteria) TaxID=2688777 RepID=UPI0025F0BF1B|nr:MULTISPECIES: YeeE/YedE family protein [unclassified Paracoccus (in: a-proteobacteria)]|tara:strand:+ start:1412 stop:2560 length:1149 start_codon:yes stop_codon:yes gene_type:complete
MPNKTPLLLSILALAALLASQAMMGRAAGMGAALAGFLGGFAFYHAAFGFAGGWRRCLTQGDGSGVRAQVLLLALILPVSLTLIALGGASGWVVPVGVGFLAGAAIFGIGMALAGSCASGTLFVAGGGNTRMLVTLAFFIAGSLLGTAHVPFWLSLPRLPALSLPATFGTPGAIAISLGLCAALAWLSRLPERSRPIPASRSVPPFRLLRGPWPAWFGALVLAIAALGMFLSLHRPWGVTEAFALWGAKIYQALGFSVADWPYWSGGRRAQLTQPVLAHATSVTNLALIAGAMAAASLAGRFRPVWTVSGREVATAALGGLAMGYGARLSSGCNIGALMGGVTSGSLHGWVWAVAAFAGYALMLRWRLPGRRGDARVQNAPS